LALAIIMPNRLVWVPWISPSGLWTGSGHRHDPLNLLFSPPSSGETSHRHEAGYEMCHEGEICNFCQRLFSILRINRDKLKIFTTTVQAHGISGENLPVLGCTGGGGDYGPDARGGYGEYDTETGAFGYYDAEYGRDFMFVLFPPESTWTAVRELGSTIDMAVPKSWLKCCRDTHGGACHARTQQPLAGFQLLDCRTRHIVSASTSEEYLALSYLWGTGPVSPATTSGGATALPLDVPAVIDDAIALTTALGFQYIWIDRYCIPQDDIPAKAAQIRGMGSIYGSSALTIIAAAGDDPDHGLPGVGGRSARSVSSLPAISADHRPCSKIDWSNTQDSTKQDISGSRWNQRGWTFQEMLLSPKRLVFTNRQIYFQCQVMHAVEGLRLLIHPNDAALDEPISCVDGAYSDPSPFGNVFPTLSAKPETDFWLRVNEYSKRSLTFEVDALDAFRGMLEAFQRVQPDFRNIFGIRLYVGDRHPLTLVSFLAGLSWTFGNPLGRDSQSFTGSLPIFESIDDSGMVRVRILRRRRLPSWSWVEWKAGSAWEGDDDLFYPAFLGAGRPLEQLRPAVKVAFQAMDGSLLPLETDLDVEAIMRLEGSRLLEPHLRLTGWTFELCPPHRGSMRDEFDGFHTVVLRGVFNDIHICRPSLDDQTSLRCVALHSYTRDLSYSYGGGYGGGYGHRRLGHSLRVLVVTKKPGAETYERVAPIDLDFVERLKPDVWDFDRNCPGVKFPGSWKFEEIVLE